MTRQTDPSRRTLIGAVIAAPALVLVGAETAEAAQRAAQIDAAADEAFARLYAAQPRARELARLSRGILMFPRIASGGFVVAARGGDGVLRMGGQPNRYYRLAAASVGLQAGVQTFSYALFLFTANVVDYLARTDGWALGTGPTVVVADQGIMANLDSTTLTQDAYAITFGQAGLMAGINLEGSRISRIFPR
jgi:lipid-binding SYLF domain-containing protein